MNTVAREIHRKLKGRAVDVECERCGNTEEFEGLARVEAYDKVLVKEKVRMKPGKVIWESERYYNVVCGKCRSDKIGGKEKLLKKLNDRDYEG